MCNACGLFHKINGSNRPLQRLPRRSVNKKKKLFFFLNHVKKYVSKEDEDRPRTSAIEAGLPIVDHVCLPNVSSLTNPYSHHHSIHTNPIYHPSTTPIIPSK